MAWHGLPTGTGAALTKPQLTVTAVKVKERSSLARIVLSGLTAEAHRDEYRNG